VCAADRASRRSTNRPAACFTDAVRLCCLVVAAGLLAGCSRTEVPAGKVVGTIRSLGYEVRFRDLRTPADAESLVGGRMRDPRTGAVMDFAVLVGGDFDELPIVPGSADQTGEGCANAWVLTTADAAAPTAAAGDRIDDMEGRLADAIFALAPGATCEG
jgi:hypothetical protein